METIGIAILKYVAVGVFLHYSTFWLFTVLIKYKEKHKQWEWKKRWAFKAIFGYGVLADIMYNIFYAPWYHSYLIYKSNLPNPLSAFIPPLNEVTSIDKLYKLTFTKRIQKLIDTLVLTGDHVTPLGNYAEHWALTLNYYDKGHVNIPDSWYE